MSDPNLPEARRDAPVSTLMFARRAVGIVGREGDCDAQDRAHAAGDEAKHALGKRGPVWWDDGDLDLNRHLAKTGRYAQRYAPLPR